MGPAAVGGSAVASSRAGSAAATGATAGSAATTGANGIAATIGETSAAGGANGAAGVDGAAEVAPGPAEQAANARTESPRVENASNGWFFAEIIIWRMAAKVNKSPNAGKIILHPEMAGSTTD